MEEEYNKSLLAWDTRPPLAEASSEGTEEIRRGPWTVDEDLLLINYVAQHGQGRWNALARSAGHFFFLNIFYNYILLKIALSIDKKLRISS